MANYQGAYGMQVPDLGSLLQMPSLDLTEEDKKRARSQMLLQMGLGLMQRGNLQDGLKGGLMGYQQGMQAPGQRMDAYGKMLKIQGDQLGNAEKMQGLAQQRNMQGLLGSIANTTANPFQMEAQAPGAVGTGPLAPDSPEMVLGAQQAQARMFQDPAMMAKLLASGMKGADVKSMAERFDPRQVAAGSYSVDGLSGQKTYNADPVQGIGMGPQGVYNLPGAIGASQDRLLGTKAAEAMAELQRRKGIDPLDINKEGAISGAREAAKFPYQTEPYFDPSTGKTSTRFVQEATGMPSVQGTFNPAKDLASMPEGPQKEALRQAIAASQSGKSFTISSQGRGDMPTAPNAAEQGARSKGVEATIERLGKSKDAAKEMLSSSIALQQAQDAVSKGAYQGRFADWQSAGAAVVAAVPGLNALIDPEKLANSQVASKHLSEQILGRIKTLGTNPSNSDREYIQKTVAQMTNDPKAFTRLTNYMQSMMARGIESHNADAESAHGVRGLSPKDIGSDYRIPMPENLSTSRAAVKRLMKTGTAEDKARLRELGYVE